jgi:hypothetical protein
MTTRRVSRLALSILSTGLLSLAFTTSNAGRSVRSDASDGAFEFLGGFWGTDVDQFGGPGVGVRTEFKLNFGSGAKYYTACMSEDGFLKFVTATTCASTDYALPPSGNYAAAYATDLAFDSGFASLSHTRGFVDFKTPYKWPQALPAMRFWWKGVNLVGDINTFDFQIVLLDRSSGTNNGNFDIEFNYGNGDQVPPAGTESNPNFNGFRGLKLGPNSRAPVFAPFGPFDIDGAPIRTCFREGAKNSCN